MKTALVFVIAFIISLLGTDIAIYLIEILPHDPIFGVFVAALTGVFVMAFYSYNLK